MNAEVARTLRSRRIHRVLVAEDDRLVGIVTTFDLSAREGVARRCAGALPARAGGSVEADLARVVVLEGLEHASVVPQRDALGLE